MNTIETLKSQRKEHPLKEVLKRSGVTTEDVGVYLGVSARTVQYWLRGVSKPGKLYAKQLDELKDKIEAELAEQ